MRKRRHLIMDVSSILKACYFAGKDKEFGFEVLHNERPVWVNGWQHGRESFMNYMHAALRDLDARPMDVIFVLEGAHGTTIRRNMYSGYKQREDRHPDQISQYNLLESWLQAYFSRMGSTFVKQDGLEADDVFAYLCKNLKGEIVGLINDGDGLALMDGERVKIRYQSKIAAADENPLGPFPFEFNRLYKAIVSDTLPGAKGVGEAGFLDLYVACEEDGLRALEDVINRGAWVELEDEVQHLKVLQKILDSADTVRRCYKCAGFLDALVNVPGKKLIWMPGMTLEKPEGEHKDDRFDGYYQTRRLIHSDNFAQLMASDVWAKFRQSPWVSIDLETSTPPESDDWLREVNSMEDEEDEEGNLKKAPGVDFVASKISGMGVTFGDNQQYTLYLTVDHKTDKNLTPEQLLAFINKMLDADKDIRFNVHNSAFELPVFFLNLIDLIGDDPRWDCGFFPRIDDTIFMASYVDENVKVGLKAQASLRLGYEQTSYDEVTQGRKMCELTPKEVFAYGTDDTIVTSALRTHYQHILEIENTFEIYRDVEVDAAYLVAAGMVTGINFDREAMRKQERSDDVRREAAWQIVRKYLFEKKWEGVELPAVTLEPSSMKAIFEIVTGEELKTQVRKPEKVAALMADFDGGETLAELYIQAIANNGDTSDVEAYARKYFKGEPTLNVDSPKQMLKLLYETMAFPIRVRNRPTDAAREEFGRNVAGSPKSDALAFASAKFYDKETHPEEVVVLDALHAMRSVATNRKMFYKPYRTLRHWKTGMIHGSEGQCMTVTRRFAPKKPNKAQWPKTKGDFRACIVPHHKDAVVVALDFKAQELRVIADSSGDEAMTSCFVGENKRDMHHMTGVSIAQKKIDPEINYDWFASVIEDESHPMFKVIKATRGKAKTTNFASEYGAQGPKMAETLMVPLEEAESYLDAKHQTFWRAEEWKKDEVIPAAKQRGYALTRLGARRHLAEAFASDSWGTRARAERQAVNFEIQGSCGEMTKLAMGRIWRARLLERFDAQLIAVVHDELVFSVAREDVEAFTKELHALMTQRYADMTIPVESSIGIGHNFKDLVEIGDQPSHEAISKALRDLFPQLYEEAAEHA